MHLFFTFEGFFSALLHAIPGIILQIRSLLWGHFFKERKGISLTLQIFMAKNHRKSVKNLISTWLGTPWYLSINSITLDSAEEKVMFYLWEISVGYIEFSIYFSRKIILSLVRCSKLNWHASHVIRERNKTKMKGTMRWGHKNSTSQQDFIL